MCGITAIVDFGSGTDIARDALRMHACIPHRGPDGEGFCAVDGAGHFRDGARPDVLRGLAGARPRAVFAFRWLQIQDSDPRSAQPMASPDGWLRLLFNGEIYNFRSLRAELESKGHVFLTASDTEVVLAAWREWGHAMFGRFEGMWAIVLVDLAARRVVLSRDRFGIKPLFYRHEGLRLLLASEAKQLLAAGVAPRANLPAVKRFIRGARPASAEETFFDGIVAVPPATWCEVSLDVPPRAPEFTPFWRLEATAAPCGIEAASDRLDEVLRASVDDHMVARAPVGVLISGGLDSSLVAALSTAAFARRGEPPIGFSMVPRDRGGPLDERPHIARLVAALGFQAHATELDPEVLRASVDEVTRAQEEPIPGIALVGQYLTFRLAASRGVRVVLDGQGADEVFGGYPRHQAAWLAQAWRERRFGRLLREGAALLARDRAALRRTRPVALGEARFIRDEPGTADSVPATLEAVLRRDVLTGNLRAVLGLTDRNAMAHSIEARVPYVHRSVVEFAFGLPAALKVGWGDRKRILRRVAARHVPREIVRRRDRIGFGAPTRRWLMEDLAPDLRALASGPAYSADKAFDAGRLGRYLDAFLAGRHQDAGTVWRLYAVDRWVRAHSVTGL